MLNIVKHSDGQKTTIRLIGRMQAGDLCAVQSLINECVPKIVLDLEELALVGVEAVRFLNACEFAGISIQHCSAYIREWMLQERESPKVPPEP